MPLKQTKYGGECPLGKFKIDVPAGCGSYTADPVKCCLGCSFADLITKGFDLEKICQCPPNMTLEVYERLREDYLKLPGEQARNGFWKYVRINFEGVRGRASQNHSLS
jgi:hypothetical protein